MDGVRERKPLGVKIPAGDITYDYYLYPHQSPRERASRKRL